MIHVLTCHHRTDAWVGLQRERLEATMNEPFRVVASLCGVPDATADAFDDVVWLDGEHGPRLNALAARVLAGATRDDLFMFLDSDAWPIVDPMPTVRGHLATGAALVAVRRDENLGEPQPHPSFAVCTAATWRGIRGDWRKGYKWRNSRGQWWTDTGANMVPALADDRWVPLLRSNTVNLHPVFFGVYGGLVYHHGAGSRIAICRRDRADTGDDRDAIRARARVNQKLADDVLADARRDPDFWRRFTPDA